MQVFGTSAICRDGCCSGWFSISSGYYVGYSMQGQLAWNSNENYLNQSINWNTLSDNQIAVSSGCSDTIEQPVKIRRRKTIICPIQWKCTSADR